MASALVQPTLTVADYLDWESQQTKRHDFLQGAVLPKVASTLQHNRATLACAQAFESQLQGKPSKVFCVDVKVAVSATEHLFYPDVVVTCDAQDLSDLDAVKISAPLLVLEVLSPSTAAYDRGQKFLSLQKLPSLQEYALLDTQAPRLEVHRRNTAGRFELYVFEDADCQAELASIGWRGTVATLLD